MEAAPLTIFFVGFEEDGRETSSLLGICMSELILQMYLSIYIV